MGNSTFSKQMGTLQIDILGTSFAFKAEQDDDYLDQLLRYYRKIVEPLEKSGVLSNPLQISIMTGILMCDELFQEKSRNARMKNAALKNSTDGEAEEITRRIIEKIDKALS